MSQQPQAVSDPATDQNFRNQANAIDSAEERLGSLEKDLTALEGKELLVGKSGVATAEWSGEIFSGPVTVTHGLGVTPAVVHATVLDNESKVLAWAVVRSITSTQIVMYGMYFEKPAAGSKAKLQWTAFTE